MVVSEIQASVKHTKIQRVPDGISINTLYSSRELDHLWSGVETPILITPTKDGIPVYYHHINEPQISIESTLIVNSSLNNIDLISIPLWEDNTISCSYTPSGQALMNLVVDTPDGVIGELTDECGRINELPIPSVITDTIKFTAIVDGNIINRELPSIEMRSFQDPYHVNFADSDQNMLSRLNSFDIKDYSGNGILFSNPNSEMSSILRSIFEDEFTGVLLEKIIHMQSNLHDVECLDLESMDGVIEMLGGDDNDFITDIPIELSTVMKLASIKYEDIFGYEDLVEDFDVGELGELGELIHPEDIIVAGDIVFIQDKFNSNSEISNIVIPKNSSLSAIDVELNSGDEVFNLQDLNIDEYSLNDYHFWRSSFRVDIGNIWDDDTFWSDTTFWNDVSVVNVDECEPTVRINTDSEEVVVLCNLKLKGGKINLSRVTHLPSKDEWQTILERKIEYLLLANLTT